jgi:hypothetical protein
LSNPSASRNIRADATSGTMPLPTSSLTAMTRRPVEAHAPTVRSSSPASRSRGSAASVHAPTALITSLSQAVMLSTSAAGPCRDRTAARSLVSIVFQCSGRRSRWRAMRSAHSASAGSCVAVAT